jgi:hypothetical protein
VFLQALSVCHCGARENLPNSTEYIIDPALVQSLQDVPRGIERLHPYVAHFSKSGMELFIVAAHHEQKSDSETFQVIERVFNQFPIKRVIIEGHRNAEGDVDFEKFQAGILRDKKRGIYDWGESEYAIELAHEKGIPVIGGEPTDKTEAQAVLSAGFNREDLLACAFVKMISVYRAQGKIESTGISELFKQTMAWQRSEMDIPESVVFSFADFLSWYKKHTGTSFDAQKVDYNKMYPPNSHGTYIQQMHELMSNVRNPFLAEIINNDLLKYKCVLVVYGSGHYAALRKAIEVGMGSPVYEGDLRKD